MVCALRFDPYFKDDETVVLGLSYTVAKQAVSREFESLAYQ